jgi:hypothetical protein
MIFIMYFRCIDHAIMYFRSIDHDIIMYFRCIDHGFEGADAMEMRHVLSSLPQADVQR